MSKIIGIDLGTTNSCCAVMEGSEPAVIHTKEGNRTMPSVVAVNKDGKTIIGIPAQRQQITNPKNTIYSAKRLIGHTEEEVAEEKKHLPYDVVKGPKGEAMIVLEGKNKRPAEISAKVLQEIKSYAEDYLGEKVTEAVITVPAYFNDAQRQATKDAGKIAGLEVKRIINEPTAAALAYGLDHKQGEKTIAVFDLGGGTFDVSILEIAEVDGEKQFEVLATNGDTHLGGDNFDQELIKYILAEFKKEEGIDLAQDPIALQRIKTAAEKAKKELSSTQETEINEPYITMDPNSGPKNINLKITRAKFEQLIEKHLQALKDPCRKALEDAKIKKEDINDIVLVGGSTRIPAVQEIVKEFFGKEPLKGINPDEVVALGAAIQGGVLRGDVKDVLLLDVTPLTLGIETMGGVATPLIERNTTIPTSKSQVFSTAADNQQSVEVHVVQGERPMAADNKSLGRFILDGIPPAPRGIPQIEVTFDLDANGILNVTAKDKGTSKEQKITIQGSSGLSDEEIEKMKKEAEEHAEEDKKKKETMEVRNNAESLVYQTEKMITDSGDKISDELKSDIEKNLQELKDALADENMSTEDLKTKYEEVSKHLQEKGQELYQAAAQQEQPQESPEEASTETKEEDTIDAEVVDEEKKEQ